jgi:NTE family protein
MISCFHGLVNSHFSKLESFVPLRSFVKKDLQIYKTLETFTFLQMSNIKKPWKISVLLQLVLAMVTTGLMGQGTGLVLSGGGAKGIAHIGVIEALEENNIKIDYIAGTSMGAIIGSLYAMGYSPEEMRNLVTSEEFKRWSTGRIDLKYRFTYKRTDDEPSMFSVGIKREEDQTLPTLPSHIVPSEVIDFALLEITGSANAVAENDFDRLMVPFRCVAADVYNKKAVILSSGNLGMAVKASMAYPLYFEPVMIDSVLLFDGGIYNNFPYQVLIDEFNPDFIIGSKVVQGARKPDKTDVMLQLENMVMQKTDFSIPDSLGIVIESTFDNISLLEFDKADSLIAEGYRNARALIDSILPETERITAEEVDLKRAAFRSAMPDTVFRNIFISGVDDRQKEYISTLISGEEEEFGIDHLRQEYFRLASEENVKSVFPEAMYDKNSGKYDLFLDVSLKESANFSTGGLISMSTYSQFFAGFNYHSLTDIYNMFSANLFLGQYYSSFKIAHRISIAQQSRLLIDFNITGNRWNYFSNEAPTLFRNISPSYVMRYESFFRATAGTPTGNNSIIRGGLSFVWIDDIYYKKLRYEEEIEPDNSEHFYAGASLSFEGNTLNRKQYSTRGNYLKLDASYHAGIEFYSEGVHDTLVKPEQWTYPTGWFSVRLINENYSRVSGKFILGTLLDIRVSNRAPGNNLTSSLINSYKFEPTPFSKQLFSRAHRANSYLGGGLIPVWESTSSLNIRGGVYLFAPVRRLTENYAGELVYSGMFPDLNLTAELALVYHTPVGPLSGGLNYFSGEPKKLFYFLNFGYILFNRKGVE